MGDGNEDHLDEISEQRPHQTNKLNSHKNIIAHETLYNLDVVVK
jgi:hypothetical protein